MGFNLNAFNKKDDTDITIDETTWPSACFGPVHHRLMKKKASKGGQYNTLAVEAERRYIIAYTPHNKLWRQEAPFTAEGPSEFNRSTIHSGGSSGVKALS